MMKNIKAGCLFLMIALLVISGSIFFHENDVLAKERLNKKKVTMYEGQTLKLKVKDTKKKVTWKTSKKSVAKVSKKGKVTAKKAGKAVITAKVGKKRYQCKITVKEWKDTVNYKGKTYELLEYNMDVFTYYYNCNDYYEDDKIYPVFHDKWDAVYLSGDIYILESQVKEAEEYYADDENYEWLIYFDIDDEVVKLPVSVSEEELEYLYDIENKERTKTMVFDDIKQFADIVKVSRDGFVQGLTVCAQVEDAWYWKTEVMTDDDREYIIALPESLSEKIFDLAGQLKG